MTTTKREHSYTTTEDDPNPAPETSYAERARTLAHTQKQGVMSTHSKKVEGHPFGSTMPYALDGEGQPIFLISGMAMHTQNLAAHPKASLFITVPEAQTDPLGAARLTLVGSAVPVPEAEQSQVREIYLARHETAKYYVDFKDFAFWRLECADLYYVGGFGVMGWVTAQDYTVAEPDPLASVAGDILSHMNADHEKALLDIARVVKKIEATEAKMTSVDRLGFHVRLKTTERVRSVRIGFPSEVKTAEECRERFVEMVKEAR
jgi:putative heme iron utilization protein